MTGAALSATAQVAPRGGRTVHFDVPFGARAVVRLPAPLAPAWAALPEACDAAFLIAPPEGPTRIGWGVAERVVTAGPERFERLDAAAQQIFEAWGEVELFVGFAFEDEPGPDWAEFGGAQVCLPRIAYVVDDGQAWLQVAVCPDVDREGLIEEVEACLARLEGPTAAPSLTVRPQPVESEDAWAASIRRAQAVMREGRAEKVVLSRMIGLVAESAPSPRTLAASVLGARAPGTRFMFAQGRTAFFGVTPERLVRVHSGRVQSAALAGSRPAEHDAEGLLDDPKERREHALVKDHVVARLLPRCVEVDAPEVPELLRLGYVTHLHTPVEGRLDGPHSALTLAGALHPTPAVCGVPVAVAAETLFAAERGPRGWYTGGVGVLGPRGEGEVWVALRAARLDGDAGQAYVGAGILPGSDPGREWAETEAKAVAVLGALGAR